MSGEERREIIFSILCDSKEPVSGNITKENIAKITDLGIDFVSSGALTHSAPILDVSLKNLHSIE